MVSAGPLVIVIIYLFLTAISFLVLLAWIFDKYYQTSVRTPSEQYNAILVETRICPEWHLLKP